MATPSRDLTDFMAFQDLLADEERMVREQARQFVNAEVLPDHRGARAGADLPAPPHPRMGELGFYGPTLPAAVRLRRAVERRLRPAHVRARARRLGDPLVRVGAGIARDVPDPRLRQRRAEGELAAAARARRGGGLLRPDRAGLRVEPGGHAHARGPGGGRPLAAQRREDVDHERPVADVAVVWAQTDEGIRGFLVEKGTPGFCAPEMKGK